MQKIILLRCFRPFRSGRGSLFAFRPFTAETVTSFRRFDALQTTADLTARNVRSDDAPPRSASPRSPGPKSASRFRRDRWSAIAALLSRFFCSSERDESRERRWKLSDRLFARRFAAESEQRRRRRGTAFSFISVEKMSRYFHHRSSATDFGQR